ncbi:phage/plasmid primase, P4 family [uncultured Gemmiger sp.]|jgi:P4 family phage/plasmid primase-like protien|uniref:phage/plasmid primase, P4 family n=1 Tax=uncultured Gemmiger sp. TaxID=1623490 RepID=UPI0025EA951F|nr:phage/plasmid primase, P4 family [uncultured Gemmiger sp.]
MKIVYENVSDRLQTILSRLKGVKKVGPNTYRAYSPLRDEKEPSLYITEKPDGTILMCDHGGGDTKAILAAIGLTMRILFPDGGSSGSEPKGSDPERKVAAIYKYLDKNGELVAEKVRYKNKTFFWRSKKPDGSYDYHKPKNVPLYNGTVLEKAEAVFLVEGEKDVDTLTKYGLPAVSLPNGAHWENEYVAYFSDKVIIILPDNDDTGRDYAKAALKALKPTNYNTGIMQLNNLWPEIPEKGDVSDYIAAKGEEAVVKLKETLDVVTRNRKLAPAVSAVPTAQCSAAAVTVVATSAPLMLKTHIDYYIVIKKFNPHSNPKYSTTDNGSGRLFSDIVRGQARYVASRKSWFIYDGARWTPDEGDMATMEMCKAIGDALTHYAFAIQDENERKQYLKYTLRWMTRNYRKTILDDAASVYNIGMGEFDADVNLLNCKNGTLDLKTMQFRSHNPDDKITKIADVVYDPNARCPRFEQFLIEVMSGDADKSAFLQKALGYALSGDSQYECMFILYGATTRNGKSTLMESILRVFGDYGLTVAPETIAAKQRNSSGPSEDLARLAGRRLANISEPSRGMRLNAAQVKSMTGNDSINARFLHCNSFDFRPQFKLYINTNYLPSVDDMSLFSSNRVRVIPFDRHFEPQEQDPNLKHLFAEEEAKSAILNWLIAGWQLLQKEGLDSPAAVVEATKEYSRDSNKIALFAEEKLIEDKTGEARTAAVYERYKEWCDVNGCMPENSTNFKKSLQAIGTVVRRRPRDGSEKTTLLLGYRLR